MKIRLPENVTLDSIKAALPQNQIDMIKPTNALILNTDDGNNYIVFVDENDNIMGFIIESDEVNSSEFETFSNIEEFENFISNKIKF